MPQSADDIFVALREASRANDAARVQALADALPAGFDIPSYVEYYRLRAQIYDSNGLPRATTPDADILAFLSRWQGEAIADRLRNDWLLAIGRRRDANLFEQQYPLFALKDDRQLDCYALAFRAQRLLGESAGSAEGELSPTGRQALRDALARDASPLLFDGKGWGDGCQLLVETVAAGGAFNDDDIWHFLRIAYDANRLTEARRAARWLSNLPDKSALDQAADKPAAYLAKADLSDPVAQELAVLAVIRIARDDVRAAAVWADRIGSRLAAPRAAAAWGQLGGVAARRTLAEALDYFRRADALAPDSRQPDDVLQWQARAALRAADWKLLRSTIERMSPTMAADPAWIYWRARAIQPQSPERARELLRSIAGDGSFYALLAHEDLGRPIVVPPRAPAPADGEVAPFAVNAGIGRSLRFYALNLRFEAIREWNWQLRGLGDRQLLAAAEYARRQGLYDRAIASAERTRDEHDYSLRYISPFRELVERQAGQLGLDAAWVYGLVRQESRFMPSVRSSVGAAGLMQVMPATAKYVAKRIGWADYKPELIDEPDTNITLGTSYLKLVYDDLDQSAVLASAAYNAGPGRARQWRSTLTRPVEGAIFAETIPFNETRDYVKRVLANATLYAALFEGRPQSLRSRLGSIAPSALAATDLP
ncbi:lytic transglycosylase domain-containing protein [Derxia lacustris]|uniref:lytic transglycosylase domain-containing protein n=1 Tax=Derxia lacustris TaxID=764842 RepID=UPI001593B728|nr:lytic transglycosylase domain-containing protein [Derxia lacustris]